MAKLNGQFTTPRFDASNNKTHEAFLHAVVFVFTSGTTKITRETDAKGKYSFDLANGEYEVSVYLKGNTEKDRFDMRAGEKFMVTATTKTDALEKWLQVIGNNGKDELAAYYENLLAQMQKLYEDTKAMRDEMVGNSSGTGSYVRSSLLQDKRDINDTEFNSTVLIKTRYPGFEIVKNDYPEGVVGRALKLELNSAGNLLFLFRENEGITTNQVRSYLAKQDTGRILTSSQYTIDSNGNLKAASPIVKLFNDHIESNDSFKEKPIFEKLSTGVYKISNTLGLSQNGWTHNIPLNSNGRGYFRVRVEHLEDGCIVRVFKIKNVLNPEMFEIDVVDGDPVDIGKDQRWIDLRFHEEQEADDEELLTQLDNLDESAH